MNRSLVIGLVVVAVAATGGFFVQRALTGRNPVTTASAPATVKADAPGRVSNDEETPPPRTIPETLPDITLPDREGTLRSLSTWKGQPVIINFWATWCGPCREEIPLLNTLRMERSADRLEVVGIAIDERQAVLKFANEIGMDYPVLMGEQEGYEAAERFGVSLVLPFSVFADSQGRIVALKVGELHADQAAVILDRVRDVDANRLSLADARRQIADKLRDLATEQGQKAAADDAG